MHLLVNGTGSLVEVWLDGSLVPDLSRTASFGTTAIGRIQIGENAATLAYDIVFDEIGANTSFISP